MENNYDSIVESVITKYKDRAKLGFTKYGTNLDRTDLNTKECPNLLNQVLRSSA